MIQRRKLASVYYLLLKLMWFNKQAAGSVECVSLFLAPGEWRGCENLLDDLMLIPIPVPLFMLTSWTFILDFPSGLSLKAPLQIQFLHESTPQTFAHKPFPLSSFLVSPVTIMPPLMLDCGVSFVLLHMAFLNPPILFKLF